MIKYLEFFWNRIDLEISEVKSCASEEYDPLDYAKQMIEKHKGWILDHKKTIQKYLNDPSLLLKEQNRI